MIRRLVDVARRLYEVVIGSYSSAYAIADTHEVRGDGWRDAEIAARQHGAYAPLLERLRRGKPRRDLVVAAEAVKAAGIANPSIVEIGCGSGYYSEVFATLAGPICYTGVDYSAAMIAIARRSYPQQRFLIGDATLLPFANASVDIAFSGNSLMHIVDYGSAIAETSRIAKRWCIFHSVPVMEQRATTRIRKKAYGVDVVEIIFQRAELESLLRERLVIRDVLSGAKYDLAHVVSEPTRLLTYVCETTT